MLNSVMETMVRHYAADLLPVATHLTERLVRYVATISLVLSSLRFFFYAFQCQLYQRLVKETLAVQATDDDDDIAPEQIDFGDDKAYAAMGMCKTIQTVSRVSDP